jgi:hypothetical protein
MMKLLSTFISLHFDRFKLFVKSTFNRHGWTWPRRVSAEALHGAIVVAVVCSLVEVVILLELVLIENTISKLNFVTVTYFETQKT